MNYCFPSTHHSGLLSGKSLPACRKRGKCLPHAARLAKRLLRLSLVLQVLISSLPSAFSQTRFIDSLKQELASSDNDTLKLKICSMLGEALVELKPDSSRYYSEILLDLSRRLNYQLKEVYAQGMLGYALTNRGDYPRALKAFLAGYELGHNPAIESRMLPPKYQDDEQFQHHFEDGHLQRLDEMGNLELKFGILYQNMGDFEKEKAHLLEAIRLVEQTGNNSLASANYAVLGNVFINLNQLDSAQWAEETALARSNLSKYRKYQGTIFLNLGRIQVHRKSFAAALPYFREAIRVSLDLNYLRGVAAGYLEISDVYLNNGQTDSSLIYANRALAVAQSLDNPGLILRSFTAKAKVYKLTNQSDSAVKYQALAYGIRDSLFTSRQAQLFKNMDFEAMQRQQELEAAKKAYSSRLQMYVLGSVLIIFFLLAAGLWMNNRQKQKAVTLLERQKQEIDRQKAKAEQALEELRNTQSQLVQKEKMASLGELTAGIAHEIQNPLNFVNNFSELNEELFEELIRDLETSRPEQSVALARMIQENERKIKHHGQRADAIVKAMLQHSRAGTGQQESVDLNALADEYLRLSYHGFRSRQKDFQARLETQFDPDLGKVQLVGQEIGRVLLNLFNNAFYAVARKKEGAADGYEPTITVSTRRRAGRIECLVRDNGVGIPEKNRDKIFQPFFTTKPAGEGTGLGLSLSYDIVKAHGGEISMQTKEEEYTQFLVSLPVGSAPTA